MTVPSHDGVATKPRKRPVIKMVKGQSGDKVKATIHLSTEASQRLTIHAAMLGLDRSALVEQLIRDHLKRFVVSDRGGSVDIPDGTSSAI